MPQVKVCGLTEPAALELAQALGAAYLGLVFFPASPRFRPLDQMARLATLVRAPAQAVGVFADAADEFIDHVLAQVPLDLLQLHGEEPPERVRALGLRTGCRTIKAIRVESRDDLAAVPAYAEVADLLLFDAKPPRDAAWPGGHGLPFDWRILADLRLDRPWALAGGLTADNLRAAVELLAPPIVDVSSGVEQAPGIKDPQRLADFLAAAGERADQPPAAEGP